MIIKDQRNSLIMTTQKTKEQIYHFGAFINQQIILMDTFLATVGEKIKIKMFKNENK